MSDALTRTPAAQDDVVGGEEGARAGQRAAHQAQIRRFIHENATFTAPYAIMNSLAAVIASYGLLQDSAAVVIGAMIVALLLGPITGIGLALVDGDQRLLRKALLAEAGGAAIVLAIGFTIGRIHGGIPIGGQIESRTAPNILDLVIALAGGTAGAYATISPKLSASIVGVAIATALVPPLCACGICLSHGMYALAGGAFVLFLTNLIAIQSATSAVLWFSGFHSLSHMDRPKLARRLMPSALLLLVLMVLLGRSFQVTLARQSLLSQSRVVLRREIEGNGAAHLADLRVSGYGRHPTLVAVVNAPWVVTPQSCAHLEEQVRRATGRPDITLQVRSVITRECDDKQFLWEDPSTQSPAGAANPDSTPTPP